MKVRIVMVADDEGHIPLSQQEVKFIGREVDLRQLDVRRVCEKMYLDMLNESRDKQNEVDRT